MRTVCRIAALVAAFFAAPAWAQPPCMPRDDLARGLAERYGERLVARGLTDPQGQRFEVFVAPDTGTWSAIVTLPTGLACWIGSGEAWEFVTEPAPAPET
jgi:hypothetical protein